MPRKPAPMPQDVLSFWFETLQAAQWWQVDPALDQLIAQRFGATLQRAKACELHAWRETPQGRLAEVIVLDQFSRNIHRGTPLAFAADPLALGLAQEAIRVGADQALEPARKAFLYMPFMHSESLPIHEMAVTLFESAGLSFNLDFERKHMAIIQRFGRYPHRNAILGRPSSPEESQFLTEPGSSF